MQAGLAQMLCPHPGGPECYVAGCAVVQKFTREAAMQHDLQHKAQDPQDVDIATVQDRNLFLLCCFQGTVH